MDQAAVELVPAILRRTYEGIAENWEKVYQSVDHIHVDVTDGVFAGDGTFRDIRSFKRLPSSEKIELHMMVHNPGQYVDEVIALNPARCAFHLEAFSDGGHLDAVYRKLRGSTHTELGIAANLTTPMNWIVEQLERIDYVIFMGITTGWSGQAVNPIVYQRIGGFHQQYPDVPIAADGGVSLDTIADYIKAGATRLCAASAVFGVGDPVANISQLHHAIQSTIDKVNLNG